MESSKSGLKSLWLFLSRSVFFMMKSEQKDVYSKLQSVSVPWDEKLRLARYVWDSPDCVIPNKQQVLLDWIIQGLVNRSKKDPQNVQMSECKGLWELLFHVLQSQELLSQEKIPVTLKPPLLQVFTDIFLSKDSTSEESSLQIVIKCCNKVMSNSQLASSLLVKLERFVPFLSSLLSFFESVCLDQSEELYILVKACLQRFLVFQRQQVNQRKVFAVVCQQLLKPLIRLVFCLDGVRSQEENHWRTKFVQDICQLAELIMSQSLFHKDHISEYQMPLEMTNLEKDGKCDEPAKKKPKVSNYTKLFLDKLREFVSDSAQGDNKSGSKIFTTQKAVLAMLPFLFREFVISSRKANPSEPKVREFNFFTEVCEMLGFCDYTRQDIPSVCGLLHQVLECVRVHDIYQVADDNSKGSLQFDWLKKLVDVLIRKGGISEAVFQCLDVLLKLNHSLLEPQLEAIWVMLWKTGSSKGVAHGTLMFSLTSTYLKLRQFDNLVSAILNSLRTVEVSALCLTPLFKKRFAEAIQGLPFGQITSIWKVFCEEIKENYIQRLSSLNKQVSSKKKSKETPLSLASNIWKKLEYLASIFNLFIVNISFGGIGAHLRGKPSVQSSQQLFRQCVKDVLEPLMDLASAKFKKKSQVKESAFFSILLLQCTLTELELFLKKFHVVESDGEESETLLPSVTWSEEIDDFVPAKSCRIVKKYQHRLLYLKNALCIQNIRFILLKKDSDQGNELPKLVSCVCSSIDSEATCSASWDVQELTISVENASVALWDLISRNAVVLFPLCNADQQLTLAQILIKTLVQANEGHQTPVAGTITMYDVSMAMIQGTSFHEVLSMQTATVCAIWGAIKHCIDSSCIGGSLVQRLSTVLNQIKSLEFASDAEVNEEQMVNDDNQEECDDEDSQDDNEPMAHDDDQVKCDEEKMEDEEVADDENGSLEGESDSDNEWSKMQAEQKLREFKAFYTLGCAVTEISKTPLFSEVGEFSAADCLKPLKVFGCLPLDWLSHDNCARCFIGLFACDVIFTTVLLKDCSAELMEPLLQSRQLLTVLFDGCVRRKRFVGHHVIDIESLHTWLLSSITQLWQTFHSDPHRTDALYDMLRISRGLMNSTVMYLLKAPSNYTCRSIVRKLQDDFEAFSTDVQQCSNLSVKKIASRYHAVSVIVSGYLAVCGKVLSGRISSSRVFQVSSAIVINLGPSLLALLKTIAQASKRKLAVSGKPTSEERSENGWNDFPLELSFLIDSFTCLLYIYSVSQQSRKLSPVNEKLKRCEWQLVFDVVLANTIHHVFERNVNCPLPEKEACTVHSCLRFLTSVCQSCSKLNLHLPEDFHVRLLASSLQFLKLRLSEKTLERGANLPGTENGDHGNVLEKVNANQRKDPERRDISEEGYDLVLSLLEGCGLGILPQLLEGLCSGITVNTVNKESMELLYVSLHIWHRLLSERFITDRREEFRPKLSEVLLALQFLVQEHKTRNLEIVQLAAGIMNKILSLGKRMLFPGKARLVLHSCLMVTLEDCDNSFPQLFESQCVVLGNLFFKHSDAVYGAFHVFISCVGNLLSCLVKRFDHHKNVELNEEEKAELTKCAQRMARLYKDISLHKGKVSKYSPYLIADYIHTVQTVAIPPAIRDVLVPGVYCLLDICGTHDFSLLHAVLEKGSRELFHSLHADYTKYHKFKGKI